jgi:anti-sigma factor ChrR (cupin superfamily)
LTVSINGDLSLRVTADTQLMDWTPSPSPSVWRKRLHRVGAPESGQVTALVRYDAGAVFPPHDHPDGEEILVLNGVFSDEHGDWPPGSYLLSPDGFRHAPGSRDGCLLFVKLRQFAGARRLALRLDTARLPWQPDRRVGIERKELYRQAGFPDSSRLEKWSMVTGSHERIYPDGAEILVIEGAFEDERGRYRSGTWLRFPPGDAHRPATLGGCLLYVKEGGLSLLEQATG